MALLMLSESDYATWKDDDVPAVPRLVAAAEPFLNAIQELENTALARKRGERERPGGNAGRVQP